jgi:DNA-binding PadR family transcriptional regulator
MGREPTLLAYALLGLLAQRPSSGYDLRKTFASSPLGHYSDSPGSIYPALRRLHDAGFVRSAIDRTRPLRPRQVFNLSARGRAALRRWLRKPIAREDVVQRSDELVLRFVFMERALPLSEISRFLADIRREVEAYTKELEEYISGPGSALTLHARLSVQHGLASFRVLAGWAADALRRVERDTRGGAPAPAPRRRGR